MTAEHLHLLIGHNSHVGRVRERNEDSYLVLTPPAVAAPIEALLVVADGVGGANAGDVASGKLVEALWSWFANDTYRTEIDYDETHPDYFLVVLKDLLELVNEHLFELAQSKAEWHSMGTTATVGLLGNGRFYIAHAGDTRAYLLRQGELRQLTADHSWVAAEVAAGRLTPEEAKRHPRRNVIMRVLGNNLLFQTDREAFPTQTEDLYIFTSDGLTGFVTDEEMRTSFLTHNYPQQACDELVALANRRGGGDNITILAVRLYPTAERHMPSNLRHGVAISSAHLGYPAVPAPPAESPASEADTAPIAAVRQDVGPEADVQPHPSQVDTQKITAVARPTADTSQVDTAELVKPEQDYDHLITQVLDRSQLQAAIQEQTAPQPASAAAPSSPPPPAAKTPSRLFIFLPLLVTLGGTPLLALTIPSVTGIYRWLIVFAVLMTSIFIGFWAGAQNHAASNPTSSESVE